jgi:hypothetical protein
MLSKPTPTESPPSPLGRPTARRAALWLALLAGLFLLRVLGQVLVAFVGVTWLPPMPEWYSGLLPYPLLLPAQIVILLLQAKISIDIWRGAGWFAAHHPRLGRFLRWFALVYFLAMVARYAITMWLYPERRWFGHSIPIFFHWVLAGYLFLLGRYYGSRYPDQAKSHDRA